MSQATHRFLYYELAHSGNGEDAHYIDLAKGLSNMNRRLYRQGMTYHIANISVHDSQGDCRILFSTAPNTWATNLAWKTAFENWKRLRAETLEAIGESASTPTWSDFKVYLNKEMVRDADWPEIIEDEQQAIGKGEWDYSDMSFWKGSVHYDNYAIGLMGAHQFSAINDETTGHDPNYHGYISCLEGLQEIRTVPESPTMDGSYNDAVFSGMTLAAGAMQDDIIEELNKEGDMPPYSLAFVGSSDNPTADTGAFPCREAHVASDYQPMARVGGFPVPCGLLQIETTASENNTIGILIEIAAGDYKGVSAVKMGV